MAIFKVTCARSPAELRAHLRKRWLVFGKEEGYLRGLSPPISMEFDAFDACSTTLHLNITVVEEESHYAR